MSRLVFNAILGGTTTLESTNSADTFLITVPAANGTLSLKDSSGDATFRNITLTGAVLAGAWNGSTITVPYGGTGATTLTGYVKGNGTSAMTASATIPVSDLTGTLGVSNGGTGATTLTGYVKGNGTSTMTASSTIPNTDITGLGTMSTQNASAVAITGGTITGLSAALPVASGGSGATTLTGYVKGNGTSAMTASSTIPNTDITGLGTMSTQGADSVAITGGTANGLTIGAINPAAGVFTTLRFNSTLSANGSTGTAGQVLTSNGGSAPTWQSVSGVGTVTSVDGSGGTTGLTLTGGPITSSGTLTLGGTLIVGNGGTGATTLTGYVIGNGTSAMTASATIPTSDLTGTLGVANGGTGATTLTGYVKGSGTSAMTASSTIPTSDLSGTISNAQLANSAITINGTSTSLGGSISVGTVTSVTGTAPVVSSGGATPAISMAAASTSTDGYLTSTDWNTFNGKGSGTVTSVSGTGTVNGLTLTGTVTSSGSLTLGGTLSLVSPPPIGTTTPAEVKVTTGWSPNFALTDAATIAWDSTNQVATFTFVSSNRTMGAPTNLKNGAFYALAVIQNGGSNTLTWNSVFKWAAGTAPTLSTAAGAKDYFVFRSDGTNLYQQGISQAVA